MFMFCVFCDLFVLMTSQRQPIWGPSNTTGREEDPVLSGIVNTTCRSLQSTQPSKISSAEAANGSPGG